MPRYIEAEQLKHIVNEKKYNARNKHFFFDCIVECDTADVAPVVHAHWVPHLRKEFLYDHGPEFEFVDDGYSCSNCNYYEDMFKKNYCAQCGAKMDEDKNALEQSKKV